jgi:hypothetical protein
MESVTDSPLSRIRVVTFVCGLIAVLLSHAAYTLVVYRARALTHSVFASSDLLLFLLPAVLAFCGYFFLLRARAVRIIPAWIAALLLTLLSIWLSLLIPFNTYGT